MFLRILAALRSNSVPSIRNASNGRFEIAPYPKLPKGALGVASHAQSVKPGTDVSELMLNLLEIHKGESVASALERLKWRRHHDAAVLDALVCQIAARTSTHPSRGRIRWLLPEEFDGTVIFFAGTRFDTDQGIKYAFLDGTHESAHLRYLYPENDPVNFDRAYLATRP